MSQEKAVKANCRRQGKPASPDIQKCSPGAKPPSNSHKAAQQLPQIAKQVHFTYQRLCLWYCNFSVTCHVELQVVFLAGWVF